MQWTIIITLTSVKALTHGSHFPQNNSEGPSKEQCIMKTNNR